MSVENLSTDGKFTHSEGRALRRAAILKRQAIDRDDTNNRKTLAKDSFLAFGHQNPDLLEMENAIDATVARDTGNAN